MHRPHSPTPTPTVTFTLAGLLALIAAPPPPATAAVGENLLEQTGVKRGIVVLVEPAGAGDAVDLARTAGDGLIVYVQTGDANKAAAARAAAAEAGFLGTRVTVDADAPAGGLHLGENVADAVVAPVGLVPEPELLRVLRPRGVAQLGGRRLVKPVPEGIDEWTHPYHGPDNNPQSRDQLVRGDLRTQFMGLPLFSPMPQQSVAAGGRVFKAFGHIAHKANQNPVLNTLMAVNAYNGTILWKRPLPPGFMIHRNTMVATADALYLGDHESCKIYDAETGEVRGEITVPAKLADGPTWKWMALRDGVLYGLVGNREIEVDTQPSNRPGLGHWPWGMWKGHDYKDPKTAFGFGRTLVAVDVETRQVLWHHREAEDFLDARGTCMNEGTLFAYSPEKSLLALRASDGEVLWKSTSAAVLDAIDANERAQHYKTGYSTTCYIKCNQDYIFFAGPQRKRLVAVKATDGELAWSRAPGNVQLVLRDDGLFAAGPFGSEGGRLDYDTGRVIDPMPGRRACTRATGCADSVFFRAAGGTVRVLTSALTAQHIAPMRPPCQDGVLVSNGLLYWGPWMCGCQLSLYGNICLGPADPHPGARGGKGENDPHANALVVSAPRAGEVAPLGVREGDWPTYLGDARRSGLSRSSLPRKVGQRWERRVSPNALPSAPVTAGGLVFVADRTGAVHALGAADGETAWTAYTGGPVYFPPAVAHDRAFVGSADGCVYAFEAATGRPLWRFRVGPAVRRVPVYGKLVSTWPVAGGVVVDGDTVYAAAGISHYDGTYVVALDARSGELKARNTTSGVLSDQVNSGVSLQGELRVEGGELRFLAGGVYETARYALDDLRCLNPPRHQINSQFRTAFYPYYPEYGKYLSLEHTRDDGTTLVHDASYEGSRFGDLSLEEALPPGTDRPRKEAARWMRRRGQEAPGKIWRRPGGAYTSFVVAGKTLLAAGHPQGDPGKPFLAALSADDGGELWTLPLGSGVVKGGTAIGHDGSLYASLEDGSVVRWAGVE